MKIQKPVREFLHADGHARILQLLIARCEDVNWIHLAQEADQWWADNFSNL